MKMKTLFLSTNDMVGGAARATYWLAKGLRNIGQEVSMCVQQKSGDHSWIWVPEKSKIDRKLDLIRPTLETFPLKIYPKRMGTPWSLNLLPNANLISSTSSFKPEIINLHWVGGGFLPISQFHSLTAPIVWSLYDMWAFTGGCHYDEFCGRFSGVCGSCPQLKSDSNDISQYILKKKKKYWHSIPMTIVAPSSWLAAEARRSSLFHDLRVEVIPHGTDLELFNPINKAFAREIIGLPKDGRLVLFGAAGGTGDKRKGYEYLESALKRLSTLPGHGDINLVIFGANEPAEIPRLGFPIHYLGRLHDDVSLAVLYSAADVTVTPSMQEAFGMTASESMACGTPVVAFGATGPLDVIDHKINGYLAAPYEMEDLSDGIAWVLDKGRSQSLADEARRKCERKFELGNVARQYANLYEVIIEEHMKNATSPK
jgi:glycosyltransferase involved in cell wall biosynthesis